MTGPLQNDITDRLVQEAAAALPPEREDEPASIRQDILDELADHLGCAFRRELLRTNGDGQRAEANVMRQFGDPRRIARKLWFDAMRKKLMLQKVLIGTCAALVAACVLFGVLLWQTVAEMRKTNAALLTRSQEANTALFEQAKQTNAAVLAELRALKESSANDPEWNPVTITCKSATTGRPVADLKVVLLPDGLTPGPQASLTTDTDGTVDVGLRQPGGYFIEVTTAWGEKTRTNFKVLPGRPATKTITCPAEPPPLAPVQWEVNWPSNLDALETRDETWLLAKISGSLQRTFGDDKWTLDGGSRVLAFNSDGRVINLSAVVATADAANVSHDIQSRIGFWEFLANSRAYPSLKSDYILLGAEYEILELGLGQWDGQGTPLQLLEDRRTPAIVNGSQSRGGYQAGLFGLVLQLTRSAPKFELSPGDRAHWEIDVPRGLISWAIIQADAVKNAPRSRSLPQISPSVLYPLFPPEGDPVPFDEREPVEAMRSPVTERNAAFPPKREETSTPIRVECVADSNGSPVSGVAMQLDRAGFTSGPFFEHSIERTGSEGSALFQLLPGSYHGHLTMPWEEHSYARNLFEVHARQTSEQGVRVETIHCPGEPPPKVPVHWEIAWPKLAKQRDDLWLVLELSSRATRSINSRDWTAGDWRIVALHPDGRILTWRRRDDVRYVSYHSLTGLADLLSKLSVDDEAHFLVGSKSHLLGVGIARWDGEGSPSELLEGLRDGRYISKTRGAFFYVFREQVPMKADEKLPTLGVAIGEDQPATISYTVPESLVSAAMGHGADRRRAGASKRQRKRKPKLSKTRDGDHRSIRLLRNTRLQRFPAFIGRCEF